MLIIKKKLCKFYQRLILLMVLVLNMIFISTPAISAEGINNLAQKNNLKSSTTKLTSTQSTATSEMAEHNENMRNLMVLLYELNPQELNKSTQVSAKEMTEWVFEGKFGWKFDALRNLQEIDALNLSFSDDYKGDRVLAFIVGLQTMLIHAYGGKDSFKFTNKIKPSNLISASQNLQIAKLKLESAKTNTNTPLLITDVNQSAGLVNSVAAPLNAINNRTLQFAFLIFGVLPEQDFKATVDSPYTLLE